VTTTVLKDIAFRIDLPRLMRELRLKEGSRRVRDLRDLLGDVERIARPKVVYTRAYVQEKGEDYIIASGVRLTSRVLRVNVEAAYRIFPYVATCGTELAAWYRSQKDLLRQFWAETIAELALRTAKRALREHLADRYQLHKLSSMAPGSLPDWPLEQQQYVFALLGDVEQKVGVRLTESLLMVPTKSVSGVVFPSESSFQSCQLCPRERCPGRRAVYDPDLYDRRYRMGVGAERVG